MSAQLIDLQSKTRRTVGYRWIAWLLCACVIAVAVGLRLHMLGAVNYWFDETFSIRMAQFSILEMFGRCAQDTHPPLFFLMLKPWIWVLGTTPWSVRLFSMLCSAGAVATAFGFVCEAMSTQQDSRFYRGKPEFAAGLAALLIALSPLQLTWAHQVRMYAPVACLTVLSTWLLWRAQQEPAVRSRWVAYTVVASAGLYTHVTMWFVLGGHLCGLIYLATRSSLNAGMDCRSLRVNGGFAMAAIGLLFAPWYIAARSQHARVQSDFWSDPFEFKLVGDAFVRCFSNPEVVFADYQYGFWIAQGLLVILLALAVGRRPFDIIVASTAALPFVALIAASMIGRNIIHARYFISGQTLVCVAVGVLIARLPGWWLRIPVSIAVLAGQGLLTSSYFDWRIAAAKEPGIPGLLALWDEHRTDDEPLIFCNPMFYTTARVYAGNADRFRVFGDQSRYTFFVGTAIMSDEEYLSSSEVDAGESGSVWICDFGWSSRFLQPVSLSESWVLAAEISVREFSGTFFLRRYDRRNSLQVEATVNAESTTTHSSP